MYVYIQERTSPLGIDGDWHLSDTSFAGSHSADEALRGLLRDRDAVLITRLQE